MLLLLSIMSLQILIVYTAIVMIYLVTTFHIMLLILNLTDDTIFYFLEGTHALQGTLEINSVSNITLQGLGDVEQGFHETVMQSTSVIMSNDNRGLA